MGKIISVKELVAQNKIPNNPTTVEQAGEVLKRENIHTDDLKTDPDYQRLVASAQISSYGPLKRDRLQTSIISRRPQSCGDFAGDFIIDGQNKACMLEVSGVQDRNDPDTLLPCQVKTWPEGTPLNVIREGEARLFLDLNTQRKNPSKVDTYRSQAFFGHKEAMLMEKSLIELNLQVDNFGSKKSDALELYTPNPFFYMMLNDLEGNTKNTSKAKSALDLYKTIYPKSKEKKSKHIHGQVLRTMLLIYEFSENGLTNGRQTKFKEYISGTKLAETYSPEKLVKNFGGFSGPKYVLHERVIYAYNNYVTANAGSGAQTISDKTLETAKQLDKKFAHPEENV